MALSKSEKERIVTEVKEVASNASTLVISDARGLKVSELSEIRTKANQSGIHIQVIKNSLAKLAFEGTDFGCSDEVLLALHFLHFLLKSQVQQLNCLKHMLKILMNWKSKL